MWESISSTYSCSELLPLSVWQIILEKRGLSPKSQSCFTLGYRRKWLCWAFLNFTICKYCPPLSGSKPSIYHMSPAAGLIGLSSLLLLEMLYSEWRWAGPLLRNLQWFLIALRSIQLQSVTIKSFIIGPSEFLYIISLVHWNILMYLKSLSHCLEYW